jgi:hypothetical protein
MGSKLLRKNKEGVTHVWHDMGDGEYVIESTQDVELLVEALKSRYNSFDERAPWKGDFHYVGSIPIIHFLKLREKYTDEHGNLDREAFAVACTNWLNENPVFKARPWKDLTETVKKNAV